MNRKLTLGLRAVLINPKMGLAKSLNCSIRSLDAGSVTVHGKNSGNHDWHSSGTVQENRE